jgi:hypothetical protein
VYWVDGPNVFRARHGSLAAELVVRENAQVRAIAVDRETLVSLVGARLVHRPLERIAATRELARGVPEATSIAVADGTVFWIAENTLHRCLTRDGW